MISTCRSSTVRRSKVRGCSLSGACRKFSLKALELKDDSHIIPRSSSVIVKRLPSARPGKGKAAMYVAGAGGAPATPASEPARQGPTGGGANSWHKGSMSKRFDGKEEHHHVPTPPKPSPVRLPQFIYPCANAGAILIGNIVNGCSSDVLRGAG